ncbi:MAG: hypothetical protein ACTSSP_00815 [Candidatus Asgardarchaeia archaeon]
MKNPEEHYTKHGFKDHAVNLANLEKSTGFFTNNADDLELEDHPDLLDALWMVEEWARKEMEKIELKYLDT